VLLPGETLLWSGLPIQGCYFQQGDWFFTLFAFFWTGFASFWQYCVLRTPNSLPSLFIGIPFILIGLYIMIGRFFVDTYERSSTRYGLTPKRVLIVRGKRNLRISSHILKDLDEISLRPETNDRGTIIFGQLPLRGYRKPLPVSVKLKDISFRGIEHAREVYRLALEHQMAA
jgi:hypothetical protein